jgi:hypothetical protein
MPIAEPPHPGQQEDQAAIDTMLGATTFMFCLMAHALAQTTTPSVSTTTASASLSTISLWLPMGGIPESSIQASVLSAVGTSFEETKTYLALEYARVPPADTSKTVSK